MDRTEMRLFRSISERWGAAGLLESLGDRADGAADDLGRARNDLMAQGGLREGEDE